MPKFRLIQHTADIGLTASGKTLAEAFGNAAYGMFSITTDLRKVREKESRTVELKSAQPETLLFDWLNSLIYFFDVEGMLFKRFDVELSGESQLKATCHGEKYDPSRHDLKLGVKSATYHMLSVDAGKNRVRVIFDV
ncbi:MAG: archease [Chloroflexota bacterium]